MDIESRLRKMKEFGERIGFQMRSFSQRTAVKTFSAFALVVLGTMLVVIGIINGMRKVS